MSTNDGNTFHSSMRASCSTKVLDTGALTLLGVSAVRVLFREAMYDRQVITSRSCRV